MAPGCVLIVSPFDVTLTGGEQVHLFGYGSYRTDFSQILLLRQVVEFLGGDNMFKRYIFGDGKWLLVQGYSITVFEQPLKRADLAKMVRLQPLTSR